jgi:hypothetical protein
MIIFVEAYYGLICRIFLCACLSVQSVFALQAYSVLSELDKSSLRRCIAFS